MHQPLDKKELEDYFHSIPLDEVTTRWDRKNTKAFNKAYDAARQKIGDEKDINVVVKGGYLIFWPEDEEPS